MNMLRVLLASVGDDFSAYKPQPIAYVSLSQPALSSGIPLRRNHPSCLGFAIASKLVVYN